MSRMSRQESAEAALLQGTLDLLILKTLALGPLHGYGIVQRLRQLSREMLDVRQGSLYPALYRLEKKGWLKAAWKQADTGHDAKFYSLTADGRRQLTAETESWQRLCTAINFVLEAGE